MNNMMQESDDLLIATLKQLIKIPENIVCLKDIKLQELFLISVEVLAYFDQDVSKLRQLKPERFRTMTKVNQALQNHLECQLELNDLMNPSIVFLRKLMLIFINKLSVEDTQPKNLDKNKNVKESKSKNNNNNEKQFKRWLSNEWIHPIFVKTKPQYRAYVKNLNIDKTLLRRDITTQLSDSWLIGNCSAILQQAVCKQKIKQTKLEALQGISKKVNQIKINKQKLISINQEDWNYNSKHLKKIKKQLYIVQQKQQKYKIQQSIFKKQVQQKVQSKQQIQQIRVNFQNPIQGLKYKNLGYQEQIKNMVEELKDQKNNMKKLEKKNIRIEQQILTNEQKITKIKQQMIDLKKKVQKRKILLITIQNQKNVQEQVYKLNEQIKELKEVASSEVGGLQQQIKQFQDVGNHKMGILKDLKMKLNKLQTQYVQVCEQLKEKEQIRNKVKVPKGGVSRLQYIKKISTVEIQWKQTQKQIKDVEKNLVELRLKSANSLKMTKRVETEIQNIINADMHNNTDSQSKNLKKIFIQCKKAFEKTIQTLKTINQVKNETQEYEIKVHKLSGKNYETSTKKLEGILIDLKKQINEIKNKEKK